MTSTPPLVPPPRLLMGPGPINADPRVLRAMSAQLVGQYDPAMTGYMDETMDALPRGLPDRERADPPGRRHLPRRHRGRAGVADRAGRPRAGAGLRPLRPPAARDRRALRRRGARHRGAVGRGVRRPRQIEAAIERVQPKLLAVVHGDTSTTVASRSTGSARSAPRTACCSTPTSPRRLAGNTFAADALGPRRRHRGPAEVPRRPVRQRPVTLSPRAVEVIRRPQATSRRASAPRATPRSAHPIRSNYFDLAHDLRLLGPSRGSTTTPRRRPCSTARASAPGSSSRRASTTRSRGTALHGGAMLAGVQRARPRASSATSRTR